MSELPKSWCEVALSDVATVILGQSPPGASYNEVGNGLPFFQGKAEFGSLYPTVAKWTSQPRKVATAGDILLSVRAPVGPTNIAPFECAIGRGLHAISPMGGVDRDYLLWAIRSSVGALAEKGTGTTFEAVSGSEVRGHLVPLAPTPEQLRIVNAIDEHFSRIDAAEAAVASAGSRIEQLVNVLLNRVASQQVPLVPLAEIADVITDGDHNPPSRVPSGVPHLTAKNVRGHRLDFTGCTFVSEADFARTRKRFEPSPGDLIVTCVGTIGRTAIVPSGARFSADRNLAAIRLGQQAEPQYVEMVLSSPVMQTVMAGASGSTAQPHLYLGAIRALEIPLPSLEEQQHCVRQWVDQHEALDRMLQACERLRFECTALRRSVLAQAFSGRLVGQDPQDEPAGNLLDDIRARRQISKPQQQSRRRVAT